MTHVIHDWARDHRIPPLAIADLFQRLGVGFSTPAPDTVHGMSEAATSQRMRLEAASLGFPMWRNNSGALQDKAGTLVRFGLANESKAENAINKSSDYVGCRPVRVTPRMVGSLFGLFVAREMKEGGWVYTGTGREVAQRHFGMNVIRLGGDFRFATGEGSFK
jgi:hypothetical protein